MPLKVEEHAIDLYRANSEDRQGRMWRYLAYGPFASFEDYLAEMQKWTEEDWRIHAIIDAITCRAVGLAN